MEYTKDIILNVGCKKDTFTTKIKNGTSRLIEIIYNNRIIFTIFFMLVSLISIDVFLVNYFLQLLSKLYL